MPQAVVESDELNRRDIEFSSVPTETILVAEAPQGDFSENLTAADVPLLLVAEERGSDPSKTTLEPPVQCGKSFHLLSTGVLNIADKCSLHDQVHKMCLGKDSESMYNGKSTTPLKSCIYIPKGDGSGEQIQVKKAKSVHFADSLGKPLKSVVTMFTDDEDFDFELSFLGLRNASSRRSFLEPPNLFKSSVVIGDCKEERGKLVNFKQPVQCRDFLERVLQNGVSVENVVFREYGVFVTVTVSNIQFEKSVYAKYTLDNWTTVKTLVASYVQGSSTGRTDTFSFEIPVTVDQEFDTVEIQFAVAFDATTQTFWDNNGGKNYVVKFQKKSLTGKADLFSPGVDEGFLLSQHSFVGWSS